MVKHLFKIRAALVNGPAPTGLEALGLLGAPRSEIIFNLVLVELRIGA